MIAILSAWVIIASMICQTNTQSHSEGLVENHVVKPSGKPRKKTESLGEGQRAKNKKLSKIQWGMKQRCLNKNSPFYSYYGGRGITICAFLLKASKNIEKIAGERPDGTSLDRINNSLGYFCGQCEECVSLSRPKNIRWATDFEQNRNKRNNRFITAHGMTKCISEWAEITGLSKLTIVSRLNSGFNPEKCVSREHFHRQMVEINGVVKSIKEWSEISGINLETLRGRIERNVSQDKILTKTDLRKKSL